jgi:hypothetical protein
LGEKKLRRNNVIESVGEDSSREFIEEGRQRSRPLRNLKFFQVWKKVCRSSGGSTAVVGSTEEIWIIEDFTSREQQSESTGRNDLHRQI